MRRFLLAVCAGVMCCGLVDAQPLSRMIARSGLSPEDFALLGDTARKLYDTASPQKGRVLSWSNPETGSHGTVKLVGLRGECVFLQHMVFVGDAPKPKELRSQRCKSADGRWLLQP